VEWDRLSGAILTSAEAPLRRRRRRRAWRSAWERPRGWAQPALAAAAVLLLVVHVASRPRDTADTFAAGIIEEVLLREATDAELSAMITGRDDPLSLLRLAVGE
jgi:anti-sigma-K factor RskA